METSRKATDEEVMQAITSGITFKGGKLRGQSGEKVKTKAKKKKYATGAHGSGSAKMKADVRRRRNARKKG